MRLAWKRQSLVLFIDPVHFNYPICRWVDIKLVFIFFSFELVMRQLKWPPGPSESWSRGLCVLRSWTPLVYLRLKHHHRNMKYPSEILKQSKSVVSRWTRGFRSLSYLCQYSVVEFYSRATPQPFLDPSIIENRIQAEKQWKIMQERINKQNEALSSPQGR